MHSDFIGMIIALYSPENGPSMATLLLGDESMLTGDDHPLDTRDLLTVEVWDQELKAIMNKQHVGDCVRLRGRLLSRYGEKRMFVDNLVPPDYALPQPTLAAAA